MNALFLSFIAAVAANSFLNLGFGVQKLLRAVDSDRFGIAAPSIAIFAAGAVAWPLFSIVLAPLALAFLEPILLAPLAVLLSIVCDLLVRTLGSSDGEKTIPDRAALSAFDALVYAAAFMSLRYCATYGDALAFGLGSAAGYAACGLLLRAIRERSTTEPVPRCLRGVPLMLIAAALMAVVFSFVAAAGFSAFGKSL